MVRLSLAVALLGIVCVPATAEAVGWCGGVSDSCQCGADNPYPCCDNGNGKSSNCTWGAWHMACCNWGKGLPAPWQHAKYWAGNYASHPDYEVHGSPSVGAIGCRASGTYGHVAYVTGVNGGSVTVHEQSCCEGSSCWPNCSWCINGFQDANDSAGYFDGGYITPKGAVNFCGDGKCNNGENCASCSQDCGGCCGNGACDNGENCSTCSGDCGQCCGNGACDFGEDCASCEGDCGICNEPPDGELEIANCQQLMGWARDIDVEGPIGVVIKANGNVIAEMTADQPVSSHPGQGFSLSLGHELKDGTLYVIEVIGKDDKGLEDAAIAGSGKQVLCRNGMVQTGIWTLQYQDAAGVEIAPVAGEGGWTDLSFFHPEGLGYPTSGLVQAAADISLTPFVKVTADLCGGLASPLYQASVGVDGDSLGELPPEPSPCLRAEYLVSGKSFSGSLLATGMELDSSGRDVTLRGLSFWSRGWRFGYSFDSSGLIWGSDAVDRLRFSTRPEATECRGYVAATHQFQHPFQGVELKGEPGNGEGPKMTVRSGNGEALDLDECLASGTCSIAGKDGESDRLEIRMDCGEGALLGAPVERELKEIRVFRDFVDDVPPWKVSGIKVWGLAPDLPQVTTQGLALRISTYQSDFVPYGAVVGEVAFSDPQVEELRGMLSYSLPGACYHGFLTVDGTPVESLQFGESKAPFQIERTFGTFGLAMTAKEGCAEDSAVGFVAVENVSYLRGGWWTTPSTTHQGLRDSRGEGCSLAFENLKWVGMEGNKAFGSLLVHRFLDRPFAGVRMKVSHTFEGPFFKLRLLLDGKLVKDFPLQSPGERAAEVTGREFQEVGLQFAVAASDVFPFKWRADVSDIEVFREDTGWISVCKVGTADPDLEGIVQGEDVTSTEGGDGASGSKSSGCGVGTGAASRGMTLLLLAAAIVAMRRRRLFR